MEKCVEEIVFIEEEQAVRLIKDFIIDFSKKLTEQNVFSTESIVLRKRFTEKARIKETSDYLEKIFYSLKC